MIHGKNPMGWYRVIEFRNCLSREYGNLLAVMKGREDVTLENVEGEGACTRNVKSLYHLSDE